jgi:hypothetical protein
MAFIPMNLNEAVESKPVSNGMYDVVITDCQETLTKEKQTPQFKVALQIEGHDNAPTLYHYQGIPSADEDADKMKFKMLLLKRFLVAFGMPISSDGFDTSQLATDLIGQRARVEITLSEPDANGNIYNRMNLPRLKDESASPAASRGAVKPPKRA